MIPNEVAEKNTQDNAVYEKLAAALDKLPNGFPQTPTRLDLQILKKLFTPDQAALACQLTGTLEIVDDIAKRVGISVEEVTNRLIELRALGLARTDSSERTKESLMNVAKEGKLCFRLAPFFIGFFEAQTPTLTHELAHLFEDYLVNGGAMGTMGLQPAFLRVIPAQTTVKMEEILPYDEAQKLILSAKIYHVADCSCRTQQDRLGDRKCKFPLHNCLTLYNVERAPIPGDVTQAEALALLDTCEKEGLVHCVNNVMGSTEGSVSLICNCCGCCCVVLRGINEWGIEKSVAAANYYADLDPNFCLGCGICVDRCQVHAITEQDGVSVVDRAKCIGCGLCVTGCPNKVAALKKKPEAEIVNPPADFATWEHVRLHNRGLK